MNLRMTHCIIITQNGKKLPRFKYSIDAENQTFYSKENNLVLDFTGQDGWTFKTGSNCRFTTGCGCVFKTGYRCTFKTSHDCTFNAGSYCVFNTGYHCIFKTYYGCVFTTGNGCTLLCHGNKTYRHFLDKSRYVFTEDGLIEIADKNSAILNMKHENKSVRNLCKDILKGK